MDTLTSPQHFSRTDAHNFGTCLFRLKVDVPFLGIRCSTAQKTEKPQLTIQHGDVFDDTSVVTASVSLLMKSFLVLFVQYWLIFQTT